MSLPTLDQSRAAGMAALDSFLQSHADAEHRVREILEKHLAKLDATCYRDAFTGLALYLEDPDLIGVVDYVAQADQGNRLEEVSQIGFPNSVAFLRNIIAIYGAELAKAYAILDERPNDWNAFTREVYYDQANEAYYIVIRLAKNNGEEAIIEGNANTMLDLATNMIRTLLMVTVRDTFKPPYTDPFVKEAKSLLKFLGPQSRKPKAEQANQAKVS